MTCAGCERALAFANAPPLGLWGDLPVGQAWFTQRRGASDDRLRILTRLSRSKETSRQAFDELTLSANAPKGQPRL